MADAQITSIAAVRAEGARIGIASCLLCGAGLLIDPRERWDSLGAHMAWHSRQNELLSAPRRFEDEPT